MTTSNKTNNPRQENCPWMMPILYVNDIQKSLDFYHKAFGFEPGMTMKGDDGKLNYANIIYNGEELFMIIREGCQLAPDGVSPVSSKTPPPMSLYVYCNNVDDLTIQAIHNKAVVLSDPEDAFWGDRTVVLQDPDKFVWSFATKIPNFVMQQETA